MKIAKFFGMFVAACVLGAAVAGSAAAGPLTLSYANFPPAPTFPCVQMERWKAEVEKRTAGAVEVQTYPGGTLLGAKNMFDGVKQGMADIGCLCMSYQPGVFPLTTVLELPVNFTSSTVASMVLWDLWEKYQPKEFAGVKVLALFATAPTNVMSRVPVKGLADLQGLELRASGGASKVLERLGAVPVSMPMSETPEALQKNLVKGLLSSLEVMKDFKYAETCKYVTMTNFQTYPFAVVMNRDSWNGLPDGVKKVFDELRREQSLWTGQYMDAHVKESMDWSRKEQGVEVFSLSDADLAAAHGKLEPMIAAWKERVNKAGLPADAIYGAALELKARYEAQYGK
ncbi:MAG: TRAP transporter substrate-binding protein [Desulfovibrionaceae bacterium]|jgi:TRAP-type C4-dicarboxylate transport system substrate-binding protein|nr:TRAP transporter substrate-binding protein [Desulfovibrionaceae bacterium]